MLIHEGFIIIFIPLIATYILEKNIKNPNWKIKLCFIVLIIICFFTLFLILRYGKNGINNIEEFQANLQGMVDIDLNPNMIYFEFGSSKDELESISINELKYYKTQIGLFIYLILFSPIIFWYIKSVKNAIKYIKSKLVFWLYCIAPFSGFLMIIIGVDYGRWFSMVITCCLLRLYFLFSEHQEIVKEIICSINVKKATIISGTILMIYFIIGPMGDIYEHFEYLNYLNNMLNYFINL